MSIRPISSDRRARPDGPRRLRFAGAALVVGLVCVALTACGSSSSASNASATASSKSAQQESARLKLRQCLREHGANVPESGGPGAAQNVPRATLQAAFKACQKYATGAFGTAPSAAQQAQTRDQLVKYASCMRENGLQIADPTTATGGGPGGPGGAGGTGFFSELRKLRQDPKFAAANSKCSKNLPNRGQGGPRGLGGGGGGAGAGAGAGGA
jgi:hypothetical protein